MSWIMKAKRVNIESVSVYAVNKEYMKVVNVWYKWEVMK